MTTRANRLTPIQPSISPPFHYTALPNHALFANAGFPFTRYADLAETAVVLPDSADRAALEQLFFLLGRMGRQTGAVALAYRLLDPHQALNAKDVDLLVLSGPASNELLKQWDADSPLSFNKVGREYRGLVPATGTVTEPTSQATTAGTESPQLQMRADGSLAGFLSFESPVSRHRTVVALIGSDATGAQSLVAVLDDNSKVPLIRGKLAVVRNGSVESFRPDRIYYLGSLPWWQWLWFHFSHHFLLLIIAALIAATTVGLVLVGALQRRVSRRLEESTGK